MAKKINYKKELKSALQSLSDLPGEFAMHLALATSEYTKIDDISDKVLSELINTYISVQEMYDGDYSPEFKSFEDEEDLLDA